MLSRLRFDVSRSAGRRYPELSHPYRNDFQRDRDRVIHARAFRRLENKTQVFAPGLSDHFRNRLTHTIEVAQVARTVASALDLNQDLTEALALVHDIGHPPFAHAGEEELDRQMQRFGEHFDHNLHALRIVEQFEQRYARFPGLNLTFEVREGIAKHSQDLEPGESPELDELMPGVRPPLEAQIIDLCDEIAYNTSDLDDGFSAGLLSMDLLRGTIPQFAQAYEIVEGHYPGASERIRMHEIVRLMVNDLVSGLLTGTAAAAEGVQTVDEVRALPHRIACYSPPAVETIAQVKNLLREEVYSSGMVREERRVSIRKIAEIFDYLMEHPEAMPTEYRETTVGQSLQRTVCDYIAGMTDGYLERSWDILIGMS